LGADYSIPESVADGWIIEGDESDAVYKPGFREGSEDEAVFRSGVLKGDDSKAVYLNSLPQGAITVKTGETVAKETDLPGERVVVGPGTVQPGGVEPGLYDGTKETGREIWGLEALNNKGAARIRILGNRVFRAWVEAISYKEPKWKWGTLTTESVKLEPRWQKVQVDSKVEKVRVGRKTVKKQTDDYEIVEKMKTEDGGEPMLMQVRCPVFERVLVPEYQQYEVPVYEWKKVNVGTYHKKSFLAWVKRYRAVKRKHIQYRYWCSFDTLKERLPKRVAEAKKAQAVTGRVLSERKLLVKGLNRAKTETSYIRETKPKEHPSYEFTLRGKKRSVRDDVDAFVEHDVPVSELLTLSAAEVSRLNL
jgi:hypothetical protein